MKVTIFSTYQSDLFWRVGTKTESQLVNSIRSSKHGSKWPLLFLRKSVSRVQLSDSMNCSPPGSACHGILQSRILEWVAIPFSRRSSWTRDQTQVSCIADRFFTIWATRKPRKWPWSPYKVYSMDPASLTYWLNSDLFKGGTWTLRSGCIPLCLGQQLPASYTLMCTTQSSGTL